MTDPNDKAHEHVTKAELALALEYVRGYLIKLNAVHVAVYVNESREDIANAIRAVFDEDEEYARFTNRLVGEDSSDG